MAPKVVGTNKVCESGSARNRPQTDTLPPMHLENTESDLEWDLFFKSELSHCHDSLETANTISVR